MDDLLVDRKDVIKENVADAIKNYVGINKENGNIILRPEFYNQDKNNKLLILLLADYARVEVDLKNKVGIKREDIRYDYDIDVSQECNLVKKKRNGLYIPEDKINDAALKIL
jgi:hypothetical protein